MCTDLTPELVQRALDGDPNAQDLLIEKLTPEIHFNVAKMLRRWRTGPAAGRDLRQEIEDIVQEVWIELFKDDAKALRRWDPQRLSLCAYVGYIAKIRAAGVLRSPRSQWREQPNLDEDWDDDDPEPTPEDRAEWRDMLEKVYLWLIASFTPDDFLLFDLLFVQELTPKQVAKRTGKTLDAIYKWRSRLYQRAREYLDDQSKRDT